MGMHLEDGDDTENEETYILQSSGLMSKGIKSLGKHKINFADFRLDQWDFYPSVTGLSEEYCALIGKALTRFSEVEMLIEQCIVKAISDRSDDRGLKIASILEFRQKVDYIVNDLKPLLPESELTKLKKMHKRLIEVVEFRNLIAHAKWETTSSDAYVRCQTKTDKDGFIFFRYYEFSEENLKLLIIEAHKLYMDVIQFIRDSEVLSEKLYDIADYVED